VLALRRRARVALLRASLPLHSLRRAVDGGVERPRVKPHSIDEWYECLKLECEIANVPVPALVRTAYADTQELIRWFTLRFGEQRLNNSGSTDQKRLKRN
jgi:hypothetical protein